MMQHWGHTHVSSALEVYFVLASPPVRPDLYRLWRDLLTIEPPVWGTAAARSHSQLLAAEALRVWTWDDYAVVFSPVIAVPPSGLHYRPWHLLAAEDAHMTLLLSNRPSVTHDSR